MQACKRCAGESLRCHCTSCGPHRAITRAAGLDGGAILRSARNLSLLQGGLVEFNIDIECLLCGEGKEGCLCCKVVGCWTIMMVFLVFCFLFWGSGMQD